MSLIKILIYLVLSYPVEWIACYVTNTPPTFGGALICFMSMTAAYLIFGGSYATYKSLVSFSIRTEIFYYGWLLWPAVYVWRGRTFAEDYNEDLEPEIIPYYGINISFLRWSINLTWS